VLSKLEVISVILQIHEHICTVWKVSGRIRKRVIREGQHVVRRIGTQGAIGETAAVFTGFIIRPHTTDRLGLLKDDRLKLFVEQALCRRQTTRTGTDDSNTRLRRRAGRRYLFHNLESNIAQEREYRGDPPMQLRLVCDAELREDRVDMLFHRGLGQHQALGDRPIGLSLGYAPEHIQLTRAQYAQTK
jgi:hypothetical protein